MQSYTNSQHSNLRLPHGHLPNLIVIGIFWLIFIAWRSFVLGFYYDDWSLLTLPYEYGKPIFVGGIYRPLNVLLNYLALIFFSQNTLFWHIYGVSLVLMCSLAIYWMVFRVNQIIYSSDETARLSALFASLAWMLIPWGLGYSVWPSMFPGLITISLMAGSIVSVTKEEKKFQFLAAFLFLLAGLTYEAFWFSFISILLIKISTSKEMSWKNQKFTFSIFTTAQLILIAWNRSANSIFNGQVASKNINYDFFNIVSYVPYRILDYFGFYPSSIYRLYFLFFIILSSLLFAIYRKSRSSLVILACILGASLSLVIFSLAGNAVTSEGFQSRTYIAINFWLVFCMGICVAFLFQHVSGWLRSLIVASCFATFLLMGFYTFKYTELWVESWNFQEQMISKIPFQSVEVLSGNKQGVMLLLPDRRGKLEGPVAFSDATAIFYLNAPRVRNKIETGDFVVMVSRKNEWLTRWDGNIVSQSWCNSPEQIIGSYQIKSLSAVDLDAGVLTPLPKGWSYGCEQN
ncbi:hypothetical protein G6677_02095 [Polynucleobacter paneuropaeus]|nr:hypothetical protein [Polynucleobacter paneuropaeus]